MLKIWSGFVLMGLILQIGCIGQSKVPECKTSLQNITLSSQDFVLKKEGGSFQFGPWTFNAEPGVLKNDAHLRVEDKAGSDIGVKIPHQLVSEGGISVQVVVHHPPSQAITPIYVQALNQIEYTGTQRITVTLNTADLPVHDLTVMKDATRQAEPDFTKIPSPMQKTFIVNPEGSGWFYTLAHETENQNQCLKASLDEYAKQLGDQITSYVDDPCAACQSITNIIADSARCRDLVNNLGVTLCDAFTAESAKESWTWSALQYGCKGASWVGGWASAYIIEKYSGIDPVEAICSNTDVLKAFLEQYKIRADCMCDLFLRDPKCKDTSMDMECQNIWKAIGI